MRFAQVQCGFTILDYKTLVEICANNDGYREYFNPISQNVNYSIKEIDGTRGTLGRALFSLLCRIPVADFYALISQDKRAGSNTLLVDETAFLCCLSSDSFIDFVHNNCDEIATFKYANSPLSIAAVQALAETLFHDRQLYKQYIAHLQEEVSKLIIRIVTEGDTPLSLYAALPQLRKGLVARALKESRGAQTMRNQPNMFLEMFSEFENYMKGVKFSAASNDYTVVEKYIGFTMRFFISKWYGTLMYTYLHAPTVAGVGESGELLLVSDREAAPVNKRLRQNNAINLAELFAEVLKLDAALFQRLRNQGNALMLPYYSIVDFVIEELSKQAIHDLNNILHTRLDSQLTFKLVSSYRGDIFLISTDASFKARIKRAKKLISQIWNAVDQINTSTFSSICANIVVDNNIGCQYDNSDSPIINEDFLYYADSSTDKEIGVLIDTSYKMISKIIEIIAKLFQLNSALEAYGSSLSYVWHSYIESQSAMRFRSTDIFLKHATISAYLNHMLSLHKIPEELYNDGYDVSCLNIYMKTAEQQTYISNLAVKAKADYKFPDISRLTTAHLHNSAELNPEARIQSLFAITSKLNLSTEACSADVISLIYKNILQVVDTPNDKYINRDTSYELTSENKGLHEYCYSAIQQFIQNCSDEQWSFILPRYKDICNLARMCWSASKDFDEEYYPSSKYFNCEYFSESLSIDVFKQVVAQLSEFILADSFKGYIDQSEEMSIEVNTSIAIYNLLAGYFALLWYTVKSAMQFQTENSFKYSPLCDINLITDLGYANLIFLAGLSVDYTERMSLLTPDFDFIADYLDKLNKADYSIARTVIMTNVTKCFDIANQTFITPLRKCCDSLFSIGSPLAALKNNLSLIPVKAPILINLQYNFDPDYSIMLTAALCGTIQHFLDLQNIRNLIYSLTNASKHVAEMKQYISHFMSLDLCESIPQLYHSKPKMFSDIAKYLSNAAADPEYMRCVICNKNTARAIMNKFYYSTNSCTIDENGFLKAVSGNYIVTSDPYSDMDYYLSKDGVWAGVDYSTQSVIFHPYIDFIEG